MKPFKLFFIIALCAAGVFAQDYPTHNVDRPYTLRYLEHSPLLYRFHDITAGEVRQSFHYPQIDLSFRSRGRDGGLPLLQWAAPDGSAMIAVSPIGAFDFRGGERDTVKSVEMGLFIRGYKDSIDFWLDARMFSESHSAKLPLSWDREFLDEQDDYSSYSRYRGHLNFRTSFGYLGFARDAPHWGPGYFGNLSLNQNAVPFNQMTFTTGVGPLTIISLYGDLSVDDKSTTWENFKSRNLYAHRYELNFENTQIGINEITVLYDLSKPWLFVPIVPLFIEKGNYTEDSNNGALSIDFSRRLPFGFRVYSEFFLDDLQSPESLIRNEYAQDKWAWLAGIAYAGNFGNFKAGSIAEYSRVEPYILTHFKSHTAQIAHLGYPIGPPNGPNSQTINWLLYAKHKEHFHFQIGQEWLWKGSDFGSNINDENPPDARYVEKSFLRGAKMKYRLKPAISYRASHYAISTEYSFFNGTEFCSRVMMLW